MDKELVYTDELADQLAEYESSFDDGDVDTSETTVFGVKANLELWKHNKQNLYNTLTKLLGEENDGDYRWSFDMVIDKEIEISEKINLLLDLLYRIGELSNKAYFNIIKFDVRNIIRKCYDIVYFSKTHNLADNINKKYITDEIAILNNLYISTLGHTKKRKPFNQSSININSMIKKFLSVLLEEVQVEITKDIQDKISVYLDIINDNKITYKCYISLRAEDYISCSQGNSWDSCHHPSGCYCAGSWSYMIDSTTIITYIETNETRYNTFIKHDKIYRMLCHLDYDNNILLTSRLYPQNEKRNLSDIYSKKLAEKILGKQNFSSLNEGSAYHIRDYEKSNGLQYPDYEYSEYRPQIYRLYDVADDTETNYERMEIGKTPLCLACGQNYMNRENDYKQIYCSECAGDYHCCYNCGETFAEERLTEVDGYFYCQNCLEENFCWSDIYNRYIPCDEAVYIDEVCDYYRSDDEDVCYCSDDNAYHLVKDCCYLDDTGDYVYDINEAIYIEEDDMYVSINYACVYMEEDNQYYSKDSETICYCDDNDWHFSKDCSYNEKTNVYIYNKDNELDNKDIKIDENVRVIYQSK